MEREFGVSFLFVEFFCDSVSIDGKSGVPGGVRSLRYRRDCNKDTVKSYDIIYFRHKFT